MSFSLEKFEHLAYSRQNELAARELIELLNALDANYGHLKEFRALLLDQTLPDESDDHVWTRVAAAISCLFSDPQFQLSPEGGASFLRTHRWLSAIFSASPFRNADHVVRSFNRVGRDDLKNLGVATDDLLKFCLMYSPESEIPLDIESLWQTDPRLALSLCVVLLSPRFVAPPAAHMKRELILPWLTQRLLEVQDIEQLPLSVLHDVYMHCSYAEQPQKHDVKRSIGVLIRRWLAREGITPVPTPPARPAGAKPVMLVVMEWFTAGHSIYRTHSRTLEAARERFHVIGMGYPNSVDEAGRKVFDEFIEIGTPYIADQLKEVRAVAEARRAEVFYMPSVGMFPITMYLSNLRLAPLQALALGHPATTHSPEMDYVIVEDDYVGDPACFSERLLRLPKDGMPYRPSAAASGLQFERRIRERPEVVQIAVAATTMKLNPAFLSACAKIASTSKVPVHFHFLTGQSVGLTHLQVRRVIRQFLGGYATAYAEQPYPVYMQVIAGMDLFINPFPFGNTNGIIDTVSAGLVGVNKTGREVHEHIDQGLFERMGFPDWLTARTVDEYVAAVVRLAENHEERLALRERLTGPDKVQVLFQGRPEIMGQLLLQALREREGSPVAPDRGGQRHRRARRRRAVPGASTSLG